MRFMMSEVALAAVRNTHPGQVWFFVMSSRRNTAQAVEAHIGLDTAKRRARMLGGVTRCGRVVNGYAETM